MNLNTKKNVDIEKREQIEKTKKKVAIDIY